MAKNKASTAPPQQQQQHINQNYGSIYRDEKKKVPIIDSQINKSQHPSLIKKGIMDQGSNNNYDIPDNQRLDSRIMSSLNEKRDSTDNSRNNDNFHAPLLNRSTSVRTLDKRYQRLNEYSYYFIDPTKEHLLLHQCDPVWIPHLGGIHHWKRVLRAIFFLRDSDHHGRLPERVHGIP